MYLELTKRPWSLSKAQRLLVVLCAGLYLLTFRPWSQDAAAGASSVYAGTAAMLVLAMLPSKVRLLSAVALAVVAAIIVFSGLRLIGSRTGSIDVRHACTTFVHEYAPRRTPELRHSNDGLELVLSFTPARDSEAIAIYDAVRWGPVDLTVYPSKQTVHAIGEEDGYLIVRVASEDDATRVKKLMCL